MFKMRLHTCRIVLLTSLVWFLAVVAILSLYSDNLSGNFSKKAGEYDVIVQEPLVDSGDRHRKGRNNVIEHHEDNIIEDDRSVYSFSR